MVGNTDTHEMNMSEVQAGDVLLCSSDDWLSKLIRLIDEGDYSHAALFDGSNIVEAGLQGVVINPLDEARVREQTYIDVYRFKSDSGSSFSDPDWPVEPVTQIAHHYFEQDTKYANNQLYLLGLLLILKKLDINSIASFAIRRTLILALKLYKLLTEGGQTKSVICSELVYRSFYEADPQGKYGLYVDREILDRESDIVRVSADSSDSLAEQESHESVEDTHNDEIQEIIDQIEKMSSSIELELADTSSIDEIRSLLRKSSPPLAVADSSQPNLKASNPLVVSEMVTPHDLQKSHNLEKVGRLRKPAG